MKMCTMCGEEKALTEFYDRQKGKDGKHAECKDCMRKRSKEWAEKLPSKKKLRRRELDRLRNAQIKEDASLARDQNLNSLNPEKLKKYTDTCSKKIKVIARLMVNTAIQKGWLVKPLICEECGKDGLLHGHHEDYGEPLQVKWLCPKCHYKTRK